MSLDWIFDIGLKENSSSRGARPSRRMLIPCLLLVLLFGARALWAQSQIPDWQIQVRKYCDTKDWESALRAVDQEISRAPQDMDIRAWRARVLAWSGHLPEAEKVYLEILKVSRNDPDNWMGLSNVYLREGRIVEVL